MFLKKDNEVKIITLLFNDQRQQTHLPMYDWSKFNTKNDKIKGQNIDKNKSKCIFKLFYVIFTNIKNLFLFHILESDKN